MARVEIFLLWSLGFQSGLGIMNANVAMIESKGCKPVEDLLPGLLDCVVLHEIVSKLQWKDVYILSSISRAWYSATRSRRVFDLRVLFRSSETLVLGYYFCNTVALYSMRDNSWHKLPPIADTSGGRGEIPARGKCVLMDGKIYVLGGVVDSEASNKVFVFDLVGRGGWEQCASMKQRRVDFGSAVIDGKIYVFGGNAPILHRSSEVFDAYDMSRRTIISGSEVYEPKGDTWSPIRPMTTRRYGQQVIPIGEELFTSRGWTKVRDGNYGYRSGHSFRREHSLEAYHTFKDEWRVVQRSWNKPEILVISFSVRGNIFSIRPDYAQGNLRLGSLVIRKYDVHGNAWINVHSFSFVALIRVGYDSGRAHAMRDSILTVGDEILALVSCRESKGEQTWGLCLFQSTGFGIENQKISWKLRAITRENLAKVPDYFVQKL